MDQVRIGAILSLLKGVLHQALHDESLTVRVQTREVFVLFCDLWSDRLTEFLYLPSPSIRAIIIHQHADSKIGLALKAKFVKTPPKPTSLRPLPSADYLLDVHLSFVSQFIVLLCTIVMDVYTSIGNVRRRGVFSSSVHTWNPDLKSLATKPQVMTSVGSQLDPVLSDEPRGISILCAAETTHLDVEAIHPQELAPLLANMT
ncbi:hypothetical protein AC1031_003126 [Aphanomyces cochlioides]|nr:hypothetical protein AC1031_003126 [Aphanomyces cochlioides]